MCTLFFLFFLCLLTLVVVTLAPLEEERQSLNRQEKQNIPRRLLSIGPISGFFEADFARLPRHIAEV